MGLNIEVQDMVMKRSFKDVICQNTQTIPELPKNVFRMDPNLESCEQIVELDFEKIAGIISGGHMSSDQPEISTSSPPSGESSTKEVWSENSANESTSSSGHYEYSSSDTTTAATADTLYENSTTENSYENSTTETYKDIYI